MPMAFLLYLPMAFGQKEKTSLFGVDNHILKNNEEEIEREITNDNEFIEGNDNIYKFHNKNIMKIQFQANPDIQESY